MAVDTNNTKKSSTPGDFFMRMGIIGELMAFLWKRKLYWLMPMMITMLVFAVLIVIGSVGPAGGFIYLLF
jgi:hypothetical protein